MHKLDFISGAPKPFIFQRESNKTNLGGLFTILFLIAIFFIIYAYLHEYFVNDKYTVTYSYNRTYYEKVEEKEARYKNDDLYPELEFFLYMGQEIISKNIKIMLKNGTFLNLSINNPEVYKMKVNDILFYIYYKCQNESYCGLDEKDKESDDLFNIYDLYFMYKGFYADHQNPKSPIKEGLDYQDFTFSINNNKVELHEFDWEIIEYTEESSLSGLFKKEEKTYGGLLSNIMKYDLESEEKVGKWIFNQETNQYEWYQLVSIIDFNKNNHNEYFELYSRQKVSIFDSIASICSLTTTLYEIVTFIFCGFYSNSFDNYKIIEKILLNKIKIDMNKKESFIELSEEKDDKKNNLLSEQEKENLIIINDNNENNNMKKDDKQDINKSNDVDWKIPKFHFYDFFYNNIYMQKFCDSSTQKIISACNDLISKYFSIDTVIYNQLKLENLFKDYKWNNPQLNSVENINLISEIKNLMNIE